MHRENGRVVVLTGAGISAESGLKTFRDNDGLWENHRVEDVATPDAFERDPELVQRFYNLRRRQVQLTNVRPNAAHMALADLEKKWSGGLLLVTQNIDNLHERAGSKELIHMHGELLKVRCVRTGQVFEWKEDVAADTKCSCCGRTNLLRPHIVWFGELPLQMDEIFRALARASLFISIGTSGVVYPAAGFVAEAKKAGAHTVELNKEPSDGHSLFDEKIYGPASEIVPSYVDKLLSGK